MGRTYPTAARPVGPPRAHGPTAPLTCAYTPEVLATRRPSVLLLVSLLVALVLPVGTANARVAPGPDRSTRSYTTAEARGLLAEAKQKLRPDARSRGGRGIGKGPQTELTTTLLALFRARTALSGDERRQADAILARPTNGAGDDAVKYGNIPFRTLCFSGTLFCVHWVTSGRNAISTTDSDRDGIPNYVEYVITTMKYVYAAEVTRMGYRKPLYDSATAGRYRGNPNGKYDIYLAELGSAGLYGYCAPEGSTRPHQSPGYCVLDNNYAPSQYGDRNFLNPLRVTAAHEFFHAIQFGYDVDEDLWFMEGTATWIEDEVFDAVNDNYQYLADSPIRFPRSAVDYSAYLHKYGAWIFFRYATEFLGDPDRGASDVGRRRRLGRRRSTPCRPSSPRCRCSTTGGTSSSTSGCGTCCRWAPTPNGPGTRRRSTGSAPP